MQRFRYNFLFVIGLVLIFGTASNILSQGKRQKNMGILSVKTSPESYPVRVDGEVVGMSGVGTGTEFYLSPGTHLIEVEGPNDQTFSREIDFVKNRKNCICLKVLEETTTRECPYNIVVNGPEEYTENSTITFTTRNIGSNPAIPINYKWTVSNGTITGGQGTSSITVNTAGANRQPITAYLDVTDDIPGSTCQQKNEATSNPPPPVVVPQPYQCDVFESKSQDDNKARFDNCVLQFNATPNSQIYIILYQGTGRRSLSVDKLKRQTLDYFVKTRGVDPRQIVVTEGGTKERTTVEIWIVPPGAQPPPLMR
ncbi:MAG TPA: hypothetical protein VGC76_03415 [Pyrinomonadaceae bacterium]|jgi:hypothetical protein